MNHSQSETIQPVDSTDLWQRLNESMERLRSAGPRRSDPAALAQKLAGRAKALRGRLATEETAEAVQWFLAFETGNQRYAIPIEHMLEVQALEHFSPVPGTPSFLTGVIHWRGAILALLDLDKYFGIAASGLTDVHASLIVEAGGRRIALVARDVEDIISIRPSKIQAAAHLPNNLAPDWIAGVLDDNRLVLRMDMILRDARLVAWKHELH